MYTATLLIAGCAGSGSIRRPDPPGGVAAKPPPRVLLAAVDCTPADSTLSCCLKTFPETPERCGAEPEDVPLVEPGDLGPLLTGYAASKLLEAKPIALPNDAPCKPKGSTGKGTAAKPVQCRYECAGFAELIVIVLPPAMTRCPGGGEVAKWRNIRGYHRLQP